MKPNVTRESLEQLWCNPANWKLGLFYTCKDDPRVIVPKRQKWRGWTINLAHRHAIPFFVLILLVAGLPLYLAALAGLVGTWIWWSILIVTVAIVGFACWYWASPDRYTKN
jgi:hypothetical protein